MAATRCLHLSCGQSGELAISDRLLIVDDDEIIREINQEVLKKAGYLVDTAEDGEAAWEIADSAPDRFNLILLDKEMPRLDGIAFLHRLKADARFCDLPVVMLTGNKQQQDITEGLNAGAYYYLTKPSPETVLLQVVRNALHDWYQKHNLRAQIGQRSVGLCHIKLAEFAIRSVQEARDLAIILADLSFDANRTVNGYSELLINAVEHGNLGITYAEKSLLLSEGRREDEVNERLHRAPYAERQVNVLVKRSSTMCTVTITDEGLGFDWQKFIEFDPERAFDLHGRGIAMSKAMSFDDIRYLGKGNTVTTITYAVP